LETSLLIGVILVLIIRIGILWRWKSSSSKFYEEVEKGDIFQHLGE
jgi:hypothetical protein